MTKARWRGSAWNLFITQLFKTACLYAINYTGQEVRYMAIMDIGIIPLGTETPSVSKYIATALKVLENEKNINYELTAMGTIIEGDLPRLLNLAQKMHDSVFSAGARRVVTTIKIDDRRDKIATMDSKVEAVNREK